MRTREHRFSRRRLEAFVDGELGDAEVERVVSHLVDCPDCGDDVRLQLAIQAALRRLAGPPEA